MADERHVIEFDDDIDNDRSYWECDCGMAGSCASYKVDFAAEKHVPEGAIVVWRSRGVSGGSV